MQATEETQKRMLTDHTENFADDVVLTSHQLYEHGWRHIWAITNMQNAYILIQHLDSNQSQDSPKKMKEKHLTETAAQK